MEKMDATRRVRIAVVGVGGIGAEHAERIDGIAEAQLCAVVDIDNARAAAIGKKHGVPSFNNHRDLIKAGLVDAVLIATPHYVHPEIGIAAMEAGLHCLSEKPISVTVAQADRFLEAAAKYKRVFAVNFYQRSWDLMEAVKEIVNSGALGDIRSAHMMESRYRTQAYYQMGGWRGTWDGEGGGALINQGVHWIDLFLLLGGLPCRVTAKTRAKLHKIEVEDEVSALLEYPNGAWGYYHLSTNEPPESVYVDIIGEKGRLVLRDDSFKFYSFQPGVTEFTHGCSAEFAYSSLGGWAAPKVTERETRIVECRADGHARIVRNFCRAILYGERLIAPGAEGLWSVEFVNACIMSGRKNKPVSIPVPRGEYDELLTSLRKGH